MTDKVLYEELCPQEFIERRDAMPVAYLPLGTLEWHGPHMPLGADALQAKGLFCALAQAVGGIVLPPLFMGPDRVMEDVNQTYYGMDVGTMGVLHPYGGQQLPGSAYWMDSELFTEMLKAILKQLKRAGFKVVVGHGHGPSIRYYGYLKDWAKAELGLVLLTGWDFATDEHLKAQNDHAGANETSLVMALRPELVQFDRVKSEEDLIGIAGEHPVKCSSAEYGSAMIAHAVSNAEETLKKACPELFA